MRWLCTLLNCVARAYALASIEIEIAEGDEMAELNHKAGSCARSCVAVSRRVVSVSHIFAIELIGFQSLT